MSEKFTRVEIAKVDEQLGLVFGFAVVSKIDGEPYFDSHGDHIPEAPMLEAATDFMLHSRVAKEMHSGAPVGEVVFAFPLTTEVARALEIETRKTGLVIAMQPREETLAKFRSGEFSGFSIGGARLEDEDV